MSNGNPIFKSRAVIRLERRLGQPLEQFLSEKYRSRTQEQIAAELGMSTAFVAKWLTEFGIETRLQGQRPPEAA